MALRNDLEGQDARNLRQVSKARKGMLEAIPADNYAIAADFPPVLVLTPAGAIDVLMPAASVDITGLTFEIYNQGAGGTITLKTSADAAFSPAITIAVNTGRKVICNGTTWRQVL